MATPGVDPALLRRHYSYVSRGLYAEQLERWLRLFPRDRLLVLKSEDLFADPERALRQTLEFLGLRPWRPAEFAAHHLASYPDLDPAARRRLVDFYALHNERLSALVGRDFGCDDA